MRQQSKLLSQKISGNRQCGVVLFVVLVMMLLLTIIGVTAMNNVTMEERMAGNLRDSDLAFQAAEATLRNGENWLSPLATLPSSCNTDPCVTVWNAGTLSGLSGQSDGWWNTHSRAGAGNISGLYANPRYILEELAWVRDSLVVGHTGTTGTDYYKVTARAVGGSQSAVSVMQTTFVKRYN